ncbi:MAG: hypothetical protein ACFFDW_12895 [Candidatus Thorarchaeota archaeon]
MEHETQNNNISSEEINEKQFDNDKEEKPQKRKSLEPSWDELKFLPNKKRFLLLALIIGTIEIAGLFILAYPLSNPELDLSQLGLFLFPPFMGALLAYFVQDKKEAVGISAVNALSSIVPFMLIFTLVELFAGPEPRIILNVYYFMFPILGIIAQILIAFTITRMRVLYRMYGDSSIPREEDEAMIAELKESRIKRGLESPEESINNNEKEN